MMSGPWPILADTADLGRRSSHDTESTLIATPVALVNFLVFSSHSVSSPWTNFDGRRTRRAAPGSGFTVQLAAACAAAPLPPRATPAATAPLSLSRSRLVTSGMGDVSSGRFGLFARDGKGRRCAKQSAADLALDTFVAAGDDHVRPACRARPAAIPRPAKKELQPMGKTLKLTAADKHEFSAYRADPSGKPKGGLIVIQEIFGVNHHIRGTCDKFAAAG